ncbi:subtilisin-like protease SBT1.4 [Papaver somniferum]|uniref:subtilisin-like protease SBT1.4 n=1 Tax=Papaver somniferum TaxID=3469 RepID=UPI000E6FF8EB|nr:subtilisin-like protease SBT1.4 [Papaver somniferum]
MLWIVIFVSVLLINPSYSHYDDDELPKIFIVYVSKSVKPSIFKTHHDWYTATLQSLPPSSSSYHSHRPCREIIYTYDHAIHGFAARLTHSQVGHLRSLPGFVSIIPDSVHQLQLHTTYSPQFLGLNDGFGIWPTSNYGEDVIIGVLDSGIWPKHPSFNDSGLTPVPKRWKGICEEGTDFQETLCNRKLIGARAFYKGLEEGLGHRVDKDGTESRSPSDTNGHGTHCAGIAAGSSVQKAGSHNYAVGEAKGMATRARIASYKIHWGHVGGDLSDILAAGDQAAADGIDVLSMSVADGGFKELRDALAQLTFGLMQKGIFVSTSGGNDGPKPKTVENLAPWVLTVGASTMDRELRADVILGDGQVIPGVSPFFEDAIVTGYSEFYYGDNSNSQGCLGGSLSSTEVAGKIVVCDSTGLNSAWEQGTVVKSAGGVGMIIIGNKPAAQLLTSESRSSVPAVEVSDTYGSKILDYIRRSRSPTATIKIQGTVTGSSLFPAPKLAAFSSRGPNKITPEILKPDIIAPGVNILAAKTGFGAGTTDEFEVKSGTSMACPHMSGLAALLRSVYPEWSPAAIKSALMTTAYDVDNSGKYITDIASGKFSTPFQQGSGHVDPNKALNPGLVYDITPSDYEAFLCWMGYDATEMSVFVKDKKVDCDSIRASSSPGDLNYPSFSVVFESGKTGKVKHRRVLTNVGNSADAVYKVKIRSRTSSVKISVSPTKLVFTANKKSLPYEIMFESAPGTTETEAFGSIEWYDGEHVVRSPIAFSWGTATPATASLISSA